MSGGAAELAAVRASYEARLADLHARLRDTVSSLRSHPDLAPVGNTEDERRHFHQRAAEVRVPRPEAEVAAARWLSMPPARKRSERYRAEAEAISEASTVASATPPPQSM